MKAASPSISGLAPKTTLQSVPSAPGFTRDRTTEAERIAAVFSNPDQVKLELEVTELQAWELAQFVKRLCFRDFLACAVDESEAYLIRDAVDRLQLALGKAGFAPR